MLSKKITIPLLTLSLLTPFAGYATQSPQTPNRLLLQHLSNYNKAVVLTGTSASALFAYYALSNAPRFVPMVSAKNGIHGFNKPALSLPIRLAGAALCGAVTYLWGTDLD